MTQQEFMDDVTDATNEIWTASWREIRDILNQIPDYPGWFVRVGYLEYEDADRDTFDRPRQLLLEQAYQNNIWDEDVQDEPEQKDDVDEISDDEDCAYDTALIMNTLFGV